MTYCIAMRLDAGLVFLSDSRTNAGVDHVNTFRKMTVIERPGDRVLVLMTAGNLSVSQSVVNILRERLERSAGGHQGELARDLCAEQGSPTSCRAV